MLSMLLLLKVYLDFFVKTRGILQLYSLPIEVNRGAILIISTNQ